MLQQLARAPGDEQLWEALYKAARSFVWAIAYRSLSGDAELASDATQETFFRLFRYSDFAAFETPEEFLAYVATVARHASVGLRRKAWQYSSNVESAEHSGGEGRQSLEFAVLALRDVIEKLDEPDRHLAQLLVRGHTLSEIARALKISYSTAGVRVFRLRRKLDNLLNM